MFVNQTIGKLKMIQISDRIVNLFPSNCLLKFFSVSKVLHQETVVPEELYKKSFYVS